MQAHGLIKEDVVALEDFRGHYACKALIQLFLWGKGSLLINKVFHLYLTRKCFIFLGGRAFFQDYSTSHPKGKKDH